MTSRLERLIKLDQAIRQGDFPSVETLCRIVEIQPRTLFQDLRELRENLGCDVRYDRVQGGYYNGSPYNKLPTFALTNEELMMVTLAAELLAQGGGRAVAEVLQSAVNKINDGYQEIRTVTKNRFKVWIRTGQHVSDSLRPIQIAITIDALREEKLLRVTLIDSGRVETVRPYCIMVMEGRWELLGYSCLNDAIFSEEFDKVELRLSDKPSAKFLDSPNDKLERWIENRKQLRLNSTESAQSPTRNHESKKKPGR